MVSIQVRSTHEFSLTKFHFLHVHFDVLHLSTLMFLLHFFPNCEQKLNSAAASLCTVNSFPLYLIQRAFEMHLCEEVNEFHLKQRAYGVAALNQNGRIAFRQSAPVINRRCASPPPL
jgi:hypothetical protein